MRKKITLVVIIVLSLILIKLTIKVLLNDSFIEQYNNGEYSSGSLDINEIMNLYEPYIVKYNYGNYYYKSKEYENAYNKYLEALDYSIPDDRICKVKINTSLSLVMQVEKMTNRDEQNKILNKAKSYLDEDCGSMAPLEDYETAEELKKIIDELLKSEGKKDNDKKDDDKKDNQEKDDLDDKIDDIEKGNEEARKKRDEKLRDDQNIDKPSGYCMTNCW